MAFARERIYAIEDIYNLPDGERAELINGRLYYMAPPSRKHQRITVELSTIINTHLTSLPTKAVRARRTG